MTTPVTSHPHRGVRHFLSLGVDEQLDVAVGAAQRRFHPAHDARADLPQGVIDTRLHRVPNRRITDHAPTSRHLRPPSLELRLHQEHQISARRAQPHECRQHRRERDERQVGDHHVERPIDVLPAEVANVAPLAHEDAGVVAKGRVQLPVAHVDGQHAGRPPLKQAVREAARRGSGVQGTRAADIHAEALEGGIELVAPAADEARARREDLDGLVRRDQV